MFLTIESARLPCCTTFSRLPASDLHQLRRLLLVLRAPSERVLQLVNEFDRQGREIVHEVERVFDLVRDAGGQLTERGELLGLDQPLLCGSKLLERFRQFACPGFDILEQARILDREHRLAGEGLEQVDCRGREEAWLLTAHYKRANNAAWPQERHDQEPR